ncbi:TetR/AcrR family transcriptional regulator [Streptomyces sp. NPDC088350]|uniref:TetR/AcrR family transcriptional regulator n=1 Tax=Streptomyces sp. NPDC088350 TaxID=3365854 RepID=UPI0038172A0D
MSAHAPPGMGTVYRAVLDTMAEHGPRQPPIAQIARLASTNRQFIYRNWPDPKVLFRDACMAELDSLLHRAAEVPGVGDDPMPPTCHVITQIVRAARLLREHPVTQAAARTSPDLCLAALTWPVTPFHERGLQWMRGRLFTLHPGKDLETLAEALLTVTAPFALIPPTSPGPAEQARLDSRLHSALHSCLSTTPACTDCG